MFKLLVRGGGCVSLVLLAACKTNEGYTDEYGNDYGYYPSGSAAAPYGAPSSQVPEYGAYDPGAYPPSNGSYGNDGYSGHGNYYSETGEVVSIPADDGSAVGNASGPPAQPAVVPSRQTYTVVRGDNLYRIGRRFGVSMESIKEANRLTSTVIHPGQQLVIPQ